MPAVVLYLQLHQPFRLRRYSVFDSDAHYFDDARNAEILRKVASKSYDPAGRLLLDLVRRHDGMFRFALSVSGCLLEQLQQWSPDTLNLLVQLARTGCVEFLAETSHHSLAAAFSRDEFLAQVNLHEARIRSLFGQTPRVFRNTELIYSNALARTLSTLTDSTGQRRYAGILCEGTDSHLGYRTANFVYQPPKVEGHVLPGRDHHPLALLLRNSKLSDDIAFRFSNRAWPHWPLTAEKFASWVHQINREGQICNLFMDFETFGEHQWTETGIFQFLEALPDRILRVAPGQHEFVTPAEAIQRFRPAAEFDVPDWTSWADTQRDLSAWRSNAMQTGALTELFALEPAVKKFAAAQAARPRLPMGPVDAAVPAEPDVLEQWRRLTTSDHVYYMSTKGFADGDVHRYFSPFDSPYDAYINFMNVLDNLKQRVLA